MGRKTRKWQDQFILVKLRKSFRLYCFDADISVNPEFPFVGATPDGKVYDLSENPPYGLSLSAVKSCTTSGDSLDIISPPPSIQGFLTQLPKTFTHQFCHSVQPSTPLLSTSSFPF